MQADRIGDTQHRRTYQNIATELGYYNGPFDGQPTPQWCDAMANWVRSQCS